MDQGDSLKLAIVCVGLPARGKSYITKKLERYLNWSQYNTRIFNVGNTRRQLNVFVPSKHPVAGPKSRDSDAACDTSHAADFFDANNKDNFHLREKWAKETLDHLLDFLLLEDGNVGIFDATNTTKERRSWIIETINKRTHGTVKILFLESICNDPQLIEKNIHLKLQGPDYRSMDAKLALEDFKGRLVNYEAVYETIDEDEELSNSEYDIQYVKIINAGKKVISYNISGYLSSQCVFFLLNFNLTDRQIWLTCNGESLDNIERKKGGDSDLSRNGVAFAKALPKFISKKRQEFKLRQFTKEYVHDTSTFVTRPSVSSQRNNFNQQFNIWTSTLKRTVQTAQFFPNDEYIMKSFRTLNNISCGSFNNITEDDFKLLHPIEYMESIENKLSYRYPGLAGESYLDVISRLKLIIIEIERLKDHVLIISHRIIIRVLLCYFMNLNKEMLTELDIQHGYVYCIEPKPYGLDLNVWQYDETTDMFCEVDVADILKRKKRSNSGVLNDVEKLRQMLIEAEKNSRHHLASFEEFTSEDDTSEEEEDDGDDDDDEEDDEDSDLGLVLNAKELCGRSESQAFEFTAGSTANLRSMLSQSDLKKVLSSNNLGKVLSSGDLKRLASFTSLSSNEALGQLPSLSTTNTPPLPHHLKKPSIDWDLYPANAMKNAIQELKDEEMLEREVDAIMSNKKLLNLVKERLGNKSL